MNGVHALDDGWAGGSEYDAGVVSFLPVGWDWDVEMGFGPQLMLRRGKVFMARQSGGGNRIEEQIPWSYTMI